MFTINLVWMRGQVSELSWFLLKNFMSWLSLCEFWEAFVVWEYNIGFNIVTRLLIHQRQLFRALWCVGHVFEGVDLVLGKPTPSVIFVCWCGLPVCMYFCLFSSNLAIWIRTTFTGIKELFTGHQILCTHFIMIVGFKFYHDTISAFWVLSWLGNSLIV